MLSISLSPPQSRLCVKGRLPRALTIFGIVAETCAEERAWMLLSPETTTIPQHQGAATGTNA